MLLFIPSSLFILPPKLHLEPAQLAWPPHAIGDFLATSSTGLAARIVHDSYLRLSRRNLLRMLLLCPHSTALISRSQPNTRTIALPFIHVTAIAFLQTPRKLSRSHKLTAMRSKHLAERLELDKPRASLSTRETLPLVLGTPGLCGLGRSGPSTATRASD